MISVPFPPLMDLTSRILFLLHNCKSRNHLHQIQSLLILQNLSSNTTIAYHFINACNSFGLLHSAFHLFTRLPRPHVFVCNSLIRAFSLSGIPSVPLSVYTFMRENSILPNNYTFTFLLKSLSDFDHFVQAQCVHAHVIQLGHLADIYVQNSLLDVYAKSGDMILCHKLFDEMPHRDVVSWTVLIMGYRNAEKYDDSLIAFEQMQYAGIAPNQVTMVNALAACASYGAVEMGFWIHDYIKRKGWEIDVILGTSLIDMYGKCGRIKEGIEIFEAMEKTNVYSWNAVIKGLALANSGDEAIRWFERMSKEGVSPDSSTLVCVLCACSHSGLVDRGREIFRLLLHGKYCFSPTIKHNACMVDLLARAGCIEEALRFMKEMRYEPSKPMWGSLLAGSRSHGNLALSEYAATKLVLLEPDNGAYYVMLSNIWAEMGKWREVEKLRGMMKVRGLKKNLGSSFVEPQEQVLDFDLLEL